MGFQNYRNYGIERVWVERLKKKAKEPLRKKRLKELADGLTKEDLQNRDKVIRLVHDAFKVLGEKPSRQQTEQVVHFILDQKIDPQNVIHLIQLWSMFHR